MNYGESGGGLSASDVALLTGNRNTGGFGNDGDNAWWIILFLIFGWGRNGFGGGFGGGSGVGENYVLATDFATIERKLDSVNSGLCDGFYAMNTGMLNGFAGVQNALCQGFSGVNSTITTNGYETRNAIFDVSRQISDCCCKTQGSIADLGYKLQDCCCTLGRGIDGINYNMSMNTNALQQTLCNNTRDIIENANANYRAIHEELVANKLEMKNERIAELQAQVSGLQLKASQEAQNAYLLNELKPCPSAAYIVPNPNCCYDYTVTRNTGCCGAY